MTLYKLGIAEQKRCLILYSKLAAKYLTKLRAIILFDAKIKLQIAEWNNMCYNCGEVLTD